MKVERRPSLQRTRVKFCGVTSPDDVAMAVGAGADAVGIIVALSERTVSLERVKEIVQAIPPYVCGIGVIGEDTSLAPALLELGLTLQFSGPTSPENCARFSAGHPYIKAFWVGPNGEIETGLQDSDFRAYENALWMFDAKSPGRLGGSGVAFRWDLIAEIARERPIVVSGGLNSDNVGVVVRSLRPYAVDVRSGIERDGQKAADRMAAFMQAVRNADIELAGA